MCNSLLESAQQDALNGDGFISLGLIYNKKLIFNI